MSTGIKILKAKIKLLLVIAVSCIALFSTRQSLAQFGLGAFWKHWVVVSSVPNPTGLGAAPTNFTDVLSWTSGGGSTASFVVVWAAGATAPSDCTASTSERVTGISASPYTVTGLLQNTQYSFRVCAADASNNLSSGVTITSTTTNIDRYIFTTDATYKGSVLPVCATLAAAAGLPNAANYQKLIGANTSLPGNIALKMPMKNRRPAGSGGPQIAMTTSMVAQLQASLGYSQTDAVVAGNAWTGVTTSDTPGVFCLNTNPWNSSAGGVSGNVGNPSDTASATWFSTGTTTCGTANRIMCADQTDASVPPSDPMSLVFTPSSGTAGTLSWTNPSLETTGNPYVIFLDPTTPPATGCATAGSVQNGTSTSTSQVLTGLTAGATYYMRLCSVDEDTLVSNGKTITVTMPSSTILWVSNLVVSGVSSTGFTVSVDYSGDSDGDYGATLYYCNATLNPGCNPQGSGAGYASTSMTKSGGTITATVSGLAPTTWNLYDVVNVRVVATDPDTANGSPLNGSLTLLNVIQPPASFSQKIRLKNTDLSGNYNAAITADGDLFGYRIAAYGRVLVAGMIQDDNGLFAYTPADNTKTDSGAVYILRDTSGGGNWSTYVIDKYIKEGNANGTVFANDIFGYAVAFDGTTIAISAPVQATNITEKGHVYIYREASVDGNWSDATLKKTIVDPKGVAGAGNYDMFGCALAVSGRNLFVGDYYDDGKDETAGSEVATLVTNSGAVTVFYDATGDGTGYPATPDKKLKQRNDANALAVTTNALFGKSIAYSGSSLIVGAPGELAQNMVGRAIVYSCKVTASGNPCGPTINWAAGTNTITAKNLTTTTPFNVPDTTLQENFYGASVSIDDDDVVVGATHDNTPNENNNTGTTVTQAGAAYVWHSANGNADWSSISMVKKLKGRDAAGAVSALTNSQFGINVKILGPVVAVGASRNSTAPQVTTFKDSDGDADFSTGTLNFHQRILPPTNWSSGVDDRFGEQIVLDNSSGAFYLYISSHQDSSESSTTDTNPGVGTTGYHSGSVFVYGP